MYNKIQNSPQLMLTVNQCNTNDVLLALTNAVSFFGSNSCVAKSKNFIYFIISLEHKK